MYLQNKYTKCYYSIINRAKSRNLAENVYVERHHIIPKALGGTDDSSNLVSLTAREHFVCHLMLPKMLTGVAKRSMTFAIWSMLNRDHSKQRSRHKVNSHVYQRLKTQIAKAISESNTGRKRSEAFCQLMRDIKTGVPNPLTTGENHYSRQPGYVWKTSGENHYIYGKNQSAESNKKRSVTVSEKKWWNNGVVSVRSKDKPDDTFNLGRLGLSDKKWWNNGVISKRSENRPGPDFNPGRLKAE